MSATDVPAEDDATRALCTLMEELEACTTQLEQARKRAEVLLENRRAGHSWTEIVTDEDRPLIVEQLSSVLATLSTAGADWRREQAAALQSEDVSINRIAAMFGVSRQRVSALLKDSGTAETD
ncbi:hypothetical protein [Modestobacter sp. SYSU DS0290]